MIENQNSPATNMKHFELSGGKTIVIQDDLSRGDYSKIKIKIVEYHNNGKAVYIILDEGETRFLLSEIEKLRQPEKNKE